MFTLRFADPIAGLSFDRLPRRVQLRFNEAFNLLLRNPRSTGLKFDVHQLWGYQNVWTVRLPPWRGVYAIDGNEVVFIVFGHRNNVYPLLHSLIPPERQHVSLPRSMRRRTVRT
jgi:mRNA-degrading endonuclease RelE of RelBE toxin-antitoxin system